MQITFTNNQNRSSNLSFQALNLKKDALRSLLNAGMTPKQIGDCFMATPAEVTTLVERYELGKDDLKALNELEAKIYDLIEKKVSIKSIVKITGVSRAKVRKIVAQLFPDGVTKHRCHPHLSAKHTQDSRAKDAMEKAYLHASAISANSTQAARYTERSFLSTIRKNREEKMNTFKSLWDSGMSLKKIAEQMGLKEQSLNIYLKEYRRQLRQFDK